MLRMLGWKLDVDVVLSAGSTRGEGPSCGNHFRGKIRITVLFLFHIFSPPHHAFTFLLSSLLFYNYVHGLKRNQCVLRISCMCRDTCSV